MRKQRVNFKGIARSYSEHDTPAGAMEELINLRTESEGLKVVGNKRVILADKTFDKVIEHSTADFNNLIAAIGNKIVRVNRVTGEQTDIYTAATANVELSVLNNMLIINCLDASSMVVYQYKNSTYTLLFSGLPDVPALERAEIITAEDTKYHESTKIRWNQVMLDGTKSKEAKDIIITGLNECRTVDSEYTEGYILVCTSYTLFDGTETKMSSPQLFRLAGYNITPIRSTYVNVSTQDLYVRLQVQKLFLKITMPSNINNYVELIKAVNVYCTKPISYYKATHEGITLKSNLPNWNILETSEIAKTEFKTELFESLLFFRQHSISIVDTLRDKYQIKFGDDLVNGKTMPVESSGWINTVGRPFIYNNRQHLYDIKRTVIADIEIFKQMSPGAAPSSTTTQAPGYFLRITTTYYTRSLVSRYHAWLIYTGVAAGFIYYDPNDGKWYKNSVGSTLVDPGWYLTMYADTALNSVIHAIRIDEIVIDPVGYPVVTTNSAYSLGETQISAMGQVLSDGGASVTERGFVYSTDAYPTTLDTKIVSGSGIGSFSETISNLAAGTAYYIRAYAINSEGTAYGQTIEALTDFPVGYPIVATVAVNNVGNYDATLFGSVNSDGGTAVTERGFVYSSNTNPTLLDIKIIIGSGLGSFNTLLTNLVDNTTYYVRAYAINSVGVAYGATIQFTTVAVVLTTTDPYDPPAYVLWMKYADSVYTYLEQAAQALFTMNKGDDDSIGIVGFDGMDRNPAAVQDGRIRAYKPSKTPSEIAALGRSYRMSDMTDSSNGMIGFFQADEIFDQQGDRVAETFRLTLYQNLPYVTEYMQYKYLAAIHFSYQGDFQPINQFSDPYSDSAQYDVADIQSDVNEWMKAGFTQNQWDNPLFTYNLVANTNDYTKRYTDGGMTKYLWFTTYASQLATGFIVFPITGNQSQFGWMFLQAGREVFIGQMNFPASWGLPPATTTQAPPPVTTTSEPGVTTTSAPPQTTTAAPPDTTTEAPTTTTPAPPSRTQVDYSGYDLNSISYCFYSNISGYIYYDPTSLMYYTTLEGGGIVSDGYYMTYKGSGVEDSEIIEIVNGYAQ